MKATFVKFVNKNQILYKLDKSLKYEDYSTTNKFRRTKYVISSTASVLGELETYLFAANSRGEVVCWCELNGIKGVADHKKLMKETGMNPAYPKSVQVLFEKE